MTLMSTTAPSEITIDHEPYSGEDAVRLRAVALLSAGLPPRMARTLPLASVAANLTVRNGMGEPLGYGVLSEVADGVLEIQSFFIREDARGAGVGSALLSRLEQVAGELGSPALVHAGTPGDADITDTLLRRGYVPIAPFGAHTLVADVVCVSKILV
ncbi:hypothetical protein DEI92_05955 [Curtobacterium sp. MCBD17_034]|nr:hypothetical protein DEI92_05955 [Curtobacterium sp. MCBD17_034]PZM40489.1 hypothetical protein DEI90_02190 [Curtobacterium sp. MCBD17_031]